MLNEPLRVPSNFNFLCNANGAFKAKLDNTNECITRKDIKQAENGKGWDNVEN